jgi:hypothetical protein
MANNYLFFSEQITEIPDTAMDWLEKVLRFDVSNFETDEEASGVLSDMLGAEVEVEFWPDFQYELKDNSLWMYTEEYGNVEHVANVVQGLIKKFMPDLVFALTWAETCSKPRLSEFGGGCVVISKDEIQFWNTHNQADAYIGKLKAKGEESAVPA